MRAPKPATSSPPSAPSGSLHSRAPTRPGLLVLSRAAGPGAAPAPAPASFSSPRLRGRAPGQGLLVRALAPGAHPYSLRFDAAAALAVRRGTARGKRSPQGDGGALPPRAVPLAGRRAALGRPGRDCFQGLAAGRPAALRALPRRAISALACALAGAPPLGPGDLAECARAGRGSPGPRAGLSAAAAGARGPASLGAAAA